MGVLPQALTERIVARQGGADLVADRIAARDLGAENEVLVV